MGQRGSTRCRHLRCTRAEVIDELYQAVVNNKAPLHNGAWAMATVEVLLAMLRSAREGSEVQLSHQVAVP